MFTKSIHNIVEYINEEKQHVTKKYFDYINGADRNSTFGFSKTYIKEDHPNELVWKYIEDT